MWSSIIHIRPQLPAPFSYPADSCLSQTQQNSIFPMLLSCLQRWSPKTCPSVRRDLNRLIGKDSHNKKSSVKKNKASESLKYNKAKCLLSNPCIGASTLCDLGQVIEPVGDSVFSSPEGWLQLLTDGMKCQCLCKVPTWQLAHNQYSLDLPCAFVLPSSTD